MATAARRRLELLGRELDQAGLRRVDEEPVGWEASELPDLPPPEVIARVGRHARPRRGGAVPRLVGWVRDQLPETFRGRTGLAPGPALLVVGLVALAVVTTSVAVLRTGADAEPVPPRVSLGRAAGTPLTTQGHSPVASASATTSATVTVDVAGKVRRPGVTVLPAGSRVVDAVERAGGVRGRVDLSTLNLARLLVDGEQIVVGIPARAGGVAASAAAAAPAAGGPLVNLNTATAEQLDTLPGVGPVTAQKILSWRAAHGAFSAVDELLEVDGIGEKTLADLAPLVTL